MLPETSVVHIGLHDGARERPVGRLAMRSHRVFFEYDAAFLASGLELSPFQLPLRPGVHEEKGRTFDGLFGVFHDSLPDGWGRLLLDREMERRGVNRALLTPLHRLACVGTGGMGALVYRPEVPVGVENHTIDLDQLATSAQSVLSGATGDVLGALLALGGSSGGARPKVLVGWRAADDHLVHGAHSIPSDHVAYLVKFRAQEDGEDAGRIELAYARMAREAGLRVTESRLFAGEQGPRYFGARRFDRVGEQRIHVHSIGGLLHADHRLPGSLDYTELVRAARALTKDQREVELVFRNMVFNVFAHNRDDHVKNFAFLMHDDGTWRAAPAFDLTFAEGPGGEHWMAVAGEGRAPGEAHLLEVARVGGLAEKAARSCIAEVEAAVARWQEHARSAGVGDVARKNVGDRLLAVARPRRTRAT